MPAKSINARLRVRASLGVAGVASRAAAFTPLSTTSTDPLSRKRRLKILAVTLSDIGVATSKAMHLTADAMYEPTPGRAKSSDSSLGTLPLCLSTSAVANFRNVAALLGRPSGLMSTSRSSSDAVAKLSAVGNSSTSAAQTGPTFHHGVRCKRSSATRIAKGSRAARQGIDRSPPARAQSITADCAKLIRSLGFRESLEVMILEPN